MLALQRGACAGLRWSPTEKGGAKYARLGSAAGDMSGVLYAGIGGLCGRRVGGG